jgi:polar amino acid transport system substrate-binding protein
MKQSKVLRVAGFPNTPFYIVTPNQPLDGYGVLMAEAVAKVLGLRADFTTTSNIPDAELNVQDGRADVGVGPITDVTKVEGSFNIIDEFITPQGFVYRATKPYSSILDLCGKTIATQTGSAPVEAAQVVITSLCKKAGLPPQTVLTAPDSPAELLDVQSGRADAFEGAGAAAIYDAAHIQGLRAFIAPYSDLAGARVGVFVAKSDPALTQAYFGAMRDLFNDGAYMKILEAWGIQAERIPEAAVNVATGGKY